MINIAIDGPSGAGKSTIAKTIAKELGYIYIDTGAMYRAVGLASVRNEIDTSKNIKAVVELLPEIDIDIKYVNGEQHVYLGTEDVSHLIRTPEISLAASHVAVIREVREKMVEFQRKLALNHNCIMDGRDIGTNVLPDANVKIFLTANTKDRAERRYLELKAKGENVTFEEVLKDMEFRDKNDSSREYMPLKKADDATLIDTSGNTLEKSVEIIKKFITERI